MYGMYREGEDNRCLWILATGNIAIVKLYNVYKYTCTVYSIIDSVDLSLTKP